MNSINSIIFCIWVQCSRLADWWAGLRPGGKQQHSHLRTLAKSQRLESWPPSGDAGDLLTWWSLSRMSHRRTYVTVCLTPCGAGETLHNPFTPQQHKALWPLISCHPLHAPPLNQSLSRGTSFFGHPRECADFFIETADNDAAFWTGGENSAPCATWWRSPTAVRACCHRLFFPTYLSSRVSRSSTPCPASSSIYNSSLSHSGATRASLLDLLCTAQPAPRNTSHVSLIAQKIK